MELKKPAVLVQDTFPLGNSSYLGENKRLIPCTFQSSEDLLSHEPRGAYTTGRTVNRNSVLEFDFHVNRLSESFNTIFEKQLLENQSLAPILLASLNLGVASFTSQNPNISHEMKLTLFLTKPSENEANLFTHVTELPSFPESVTVEARRAERHNPTIKDTEWVRLRKKLEELKSPESNDVLLVTDTGDILEGSQSNFFAVDEEGTLQTAPDDLVLPGTIRNIVISAAKEIGIPVSMVAPKVEDATSWSSCFLTSSSRLLLPVNEVLFPEAEPPFQLSFETSETVKKLQELLWKDMQRRSTPLSG